MNLIEWLHITNKFIKKNETRTSTHLLMNGGSLDISSDYQKFLELYADNIKKTKLYIIEKRTPIFNFFCDLDFINLKIVNYQEVVLKIQELINLIYEDNHECIICSAKNKNVIKNSITYIKQGFHLHWPTLKVDNKIALQLRNLIVNKLKNIYGKVESSYNTWENIIDECVYTTNGIRMCGSNKGYYADNIFMDEDRPYYPIKIMKITGEDNDIELKKMQDLKYMINKCSIRTENKEITLIKNNLLEECKECEQPPTEQNGKIRLDTTSIEYIEIIKFFKCHIKDYSTDDIKKIFKYDSGNVYIILTRSKYCQNVNRRHNSCQIYFKLNRHGICQGCHCNCDTLEGRKYGYCRNFFSTYIPCSKYLLKILKWNSKNLIERQNSVDTFRGLLFDSFTNKSPLRDRKKSKECLE